MTRLTITAAALALCLTLPGAASAADLRWGVLGGYNFGLGARGEVADTAPAAIRKSCRPAPATSRPGARSAAGSGAPAAPRA